MAYEPKPLDTSGITLSPDVLNLREMLAKNAHDVWAQERMAQGWIWGERRDDTKKLHPCLIPYEELPESEKEYDRNTAMETLKAICAAGYRIEKI
jgi:ryanodine receptor 2